ncbi:MAG TPA: sigma-54 dependent transcriptional regulator [Blastocatellia bacterium]|nr:sigma-54 dependent transcriptional regulator [Blastocatellia bacterium]
MIDPTKLSVSRLPAATGPSNNRFGPSEIIGQSPQARAMLDFIYKAAANDFSVLMEGESGTGKDLMARAIHLASARASGPFVAVNCGAMNPNLIESELFGHEKGAFTGAVSRKFGRFERANKGTLFLDEIGELPLQDQVKLLRALQERRIERVGGTEEIEVDVRIIAATNRVLLDEVDAGNFRQDLYYRLAVMTFIMPALRDRVEDIPPLARHFLTMHCERMKLPVPSLTPEAETALLRHSWPGNVRELENLIERTLALNGAEEIKAESLVFQTRRTRSKIHPKIGIERPALPDHGEARIPPSFQFNNLSSSEKREMVKQALKRCYGNRTRAAALLGLSSRHRLYRLMIKLGVTRETED